MITKPYGHLIVTYTRKPGGAINVIHPCPDGVPADPMAAARDAVADSTGELLRVQVWDGAGFPAIYDPDPLYTESGR